MNDKLREALEQNVKVMRAAADKVQDPIVANGLYAAAMLEAQPAERNFCERCGKRLGGGIHTCTPSADDHPLMHSKPAKPQAPDMEASE